MPRLVLLLFPFHINFLSCLVFNSTFHICGLNIVSELSMEGEGGGTLDFAQYGNPAIVYFWEVILDQCKGCIDSPPPSFPTQMRGVEGDQRVK